MAPAAPGGGWDTTARAFQGVVARRPSSTTGIEVFNVEGAGGTLGLSQLVSKDSGDPYQLMMTGLVMLGAIETNGSDVAADAHDADRDDDHRDRGRSSCRRTPSTSRSRTSRPTSSATRARSAGRAARRAATDQLLVGELARVLGADPRKTKYVAHSGGGEANAAILSGSVDAGVSGLSEFTDQVEAGQDAAARGLLAGRRRDRRAQAADDQGRRASTSS